MKRKGITYLSNSQVTKEGYTFYGMPYIFPKDKTQEFYSKIPKTDVLIAH